MFTIDTHTHIIPKHLPDFSKKFGYGEFITLDHHEERKAWMMQGNKRFREIQDNCWDAEVRINEMAQHQAHMQVICTIPVMFSYWAKAQDCLEVSQFLNDDIAATVNNHPDKFIGLATVPMQDAPLAVKELERCMKNGFKGVQIGSNVNNLNLNETQFDEFFAACESLNAAVLVHPWQMMGQEHMSKYWLPWLVGMPAEISRAICSMIFGGVFEKYIQMRLNSLGHPTARIIHRFDVPCIGKGNKHFNPVKFINEYGKLIYSQPSDSLTEDFKPPFNKIVFGRTIYNKRKRMVSEAKDFTKSNYLSLQMIHGILQDLVFNEFKPKDKQYNLSENDWQFMMKHLGMYPRESEWPRYNPKTYYDSYKKYFIYGGATPVINSDTLRIFNIVGRAYGFQIDCAYIVDFRTNTEYMLSAVIYTNKRNSFGTGSYEYDTVGLPYLKELSLALYNLEKGRKKKVEPNLNSINFYKKEE